MLISAPSATVKYADLLAEWLVELGYTHCFFVAGGAIMHLLDGVRTRMTCVPVVHEVAAGIAAEYFNESGGEGRAFALVTAGPGVTNILTAMAGAWLESRELLVLAGQVKSTDLATGGIRQRGIQEIDGVSLAAPVAVRAENLARPIGKDEFVRTVRSGTSGRPGPVFLEVCLDVQGAPVERLAMEQPALAVEAVPDEDPIAVAAYAVDEVANRLRRATRPVLLIGGGVSREAAAAVRERLHRTGLPLMTTWNGADRVDFREPLYFGRPNTWGQRYANVILQQADCIVALGTRLGLQQTGFNWQAFAPHAEIVQVDVDRAELEKGHPRIALGIAGDADTMLRGLAALSYPGYTPWVRFAEAVRSLLPVDEACNTTAPGFLSPYRFVLDLCELLRDDDVVIPCSSGGANSVPMQTLRQKAGQVVITDKGLASMGYGLAGAIGAALAHPMRRTILIEGDGGFAQNLQELATAAVNGLDLKIFLFANDGYASIRATQRNYFGGAYLGCDVPSGLGFPRWDRLFSAYDIPLLTLDEHGLAEEDVRRALDAPGPHGFVVPIDPEQTYFPKITSRVTETGSMESQPLHLMSPPLPDDVASRVFPFLRDESR